MVGLLASLLSFSNTAAEPTDLVRSNIRDRVGLQLYSLRDSFAKDVRGTLDQVRAMGFRYVELAGTYGMTAVEFKRQLDERELESVSAIYPYRSFVDDIDRVAADCTALGVKFAGCAWIDHTAPFNEETCRKAIADFKTAAHILAEYEIQFFYHIHGYEFQPHEHGTLFDLLARETADSQVAFEIDIFWVQHAGLDPAMLLNRYRDRFQLTHLKDMKVGTKTGHLTGQSNTSNDVAIGKGQIDIPRFLAAAEEVGIKWHFIEDESPTAQKQIPQSLRYLERAAW